jgi:co-chaperonin GroES (HSP10)
MKTFIPAKGKLLVCIAPEKELSEGGIVLAPSNDKKSMTQGNVIAVGSNCDPIGVGDIVYFGPYVGTIFNEDSDGTSYLILKNEDILGWEYV